MFKPSSMILAANKNKYHKLFHILILLLLSSTLSAQNIYSQNKKIIIRYLYSIDSFYNNKLGLPTGVFVDRKLNEIYITDNRKNEILIFESNGTPIFKIDKKKGIRSPIDLVVSNGLIYITQEGKNFIEVFDYRGDLVRKIIPPDNITFIPGRLAIDENDNLYVINKAKTNCLVFNKNGKLINEIGNGLFSLASVTIYNERIYLITPFDDSAIQVFDKSGKKLMKYMAMAGDMGTNLGIPSSAALDKSGNLWLIDSLRGVITYNIEGKEISRSSEYGLGEIKAFYPIDIDFNGDNMLFIVNKMAKSVDVFKIGY